MIQTPAEVSAQTLASDEARPISSVDLIISEIKRNKRGAALILTLLAVVVLGTAFALSRFIGQKPEENKTSSPFQTMNMTKLTSTGNLAGAAISPDGKYIIYVIDDAGRQSLWLRQAATTSNVQILRPARDRSYRGLAFSRDGNYIYYLGREKGEPRATLYQMTVLGGEPKKLIADISIQDTLSNISFSPDGKRIALIRLDENFNRSLVVINTDGTGERALASRTLPEYLAGAAWSPDGNIIVCLEGSFARGGSVGGGNRSFIEVRADDGTEKAFSQKQWGYVEAFTWLSDASGLIISTIEKAGQPQLWRVSYPEGEAYRITNDLSGYMGVSLTADSRTLVTVQGEQSANIWIVPEADQTRAQKITSATSDYAGLCWTPDGRIVYQSAASGNQDIWIMSEDGTGQKQLTSDAGSNSFPSVSPDGRYIVFSSDRSHQASIWRMNSDGADPRQLVDGGSIPDCSPDGKWVVYYRHSPQGVHVWRVPIEGGDPVQLTFKDTVGRPAVSPDAKLIACNYLSQQPNSRFHVALLPFEGGEPVKILDVASSPIREIRWTPDGRAISYVETHNGVSNIWIQPIEGGPSKQLTDFKSDLIFSFDWSPDGKQFVCSRGTSTTDAVLISDFC